MTTPSIALVIGSGSVKCAAALGVQRVLKRENIPVNMVVGCSGGSIYAALLALGYEIDKVQEMALQLWTHDLTSRPNRRALWQALFPKWLGFSARFGLRDDRPVLRRLQQTYGSSTFADTKIPLYITATDFYTGEQVTLSKGLLVDAIRASIAIPFTFSPWPVGEQLLMDGFMSDPLPVGVAMREGAGLIVAVGFESPYQSRVNSAVRFAFQISSVMTNNLLKSQFAFHNLAHHSEVILVVPTFEQKVGLFDTDKIPYVIAKGEEAMEEQIGYLKQLISQ